MGLKKCPSCFKDVSEKAKSCPNCGHPITTGGSGCGLFLIIVFAILAAVLLISFG